MKVFRLLFSISLITILPAVIYLGGCSDSIVNSTGASTGYQARSEKEFAVNTGLNAEPGAVVVVQLEHLNSPPDSVDMDTGTIGEDIIPFAYTKSSMHNFRLDDSSEFRVKLINSSSGAVIYELTPASPNISVNIPAGEYKLYITSLLIYGSVSLGKQIVFIQQDTTDTNNFGYDSTQLNTFFRTGKCLKCDLQYVNLSGMTLNDVVLDNSNLMYSDLSNTTLINSSFVNCEMNYANLSHVVNANGTVFTGGKFYSANFMQSNLQQTNFRVALLRSANLSYANLSNSDCRGTFFCGANKEFLLSINILVDETTLCWP